MESEVIRFEDYIYDRGLLKKGWAHLGWGNFARAFVGDLANRLAASSDQQGPLRDYGVVAIAPTMRQQRDINILKEQDTIYSLLLRNSHEVCQRVGAVREAILGVEDTARVIRRLAGPETKIISLTTTKNGYLLDDDGNFAFEPKGEKLRPEIDALKARDWSRVSTVPGWVVASLYERFQNDQEPPIILSFDNLPSFNGKTAKQLITSFAKEMGNDDFSRYVNERVIYPNTVVDRITPQQRYQEQENYLLRANPQYNDRIPVVCEDHLKLVIENTPGLPEKFQRDFQGIGVKFVDNIEPYMRSKVLMANGLHMLSGFFGSILQRPTVLDVMRDPPLRTVIDRFHDQVIGSLQPSHPEDLQKYRMSIVSRMENPKLSDSNSRLVGKTTSKIGARVFLVEALEQGSPADTSAFGVALWLRFLQGRDISNNPYSVDRDDADTIEHHGLDLSRRGFKGNLFNFLKPSAPRVDPEVLVHFVRDVESDLHIIQSRGPREAIEARFLKGGPS